LVKDHPERHLPAPHAPNNLQISSRNCRAYCDLAPRAARLGQRRTPLAAKALFAGKGELRQLPPREWYRARASARIGDIRRWPSRRDRAALVEPNEEGLAAEPSYRA